MRPRVEIDEGRGLVRWTRFVVRWRWVVLGLWIVIGVGSFAAAAGLGDLLTNRFTLPGTDTYRVDGVLDAEFGQQSTGSFTVVAEAAGIVGHLTEVEAAAARAADAIPTGQLVGVVPVSADVASATIVSNLVPADAKGYTDDIREALGSVDGVRLSVTGQAAVERDLEPIQDEDLQRGEFVIAVPLAFVILVAVFGTLAFLIPFAFALSAIPATLGVVWLVANVMELSTYVTQLVSLIGLGIAIDYSLLIVYRYREERQAGRSKEDAVVATMQTAGRAVVFSGTAVAIGLALLLAMPLPFIRGFGIAGLTIPIVSVVCALTLMPALLHLWADGLDRVRLVPRRFVQRGAEGEGRFWYSLARAIMRRPAAFAALAVALLLAAAIPAFWLDVGPGTNQGIPQDLESTRALSVLGDAAGEGAIAPTDLIVDTGRAGGAQHPDVLAALDRLKQGLAADPEVETVVTLPGAQGVDPSGRYIHLQAIGRSEYGVPEAMDYVHRLRDDIVPAAGFPSGVDVLAGGGPPSSVDFLHLTYGTFPWLVVAVLALTYILLLRAFRSLLLPLKAIVLNLLSIGAAYGLLVAFFKWGAGDPFGLQSYDQVEGWIPVFLFAMLFGLSMDYEVFLVSRMREEWDGGSANPDAVAVGLAKTGRIVTAAGLIMIAAFSGFMIGRILGLQQFGFGLAVAIAVDVTVVRALLLPSAMALLGRWNWWLPERVARFARVQPSPLTPKRAAVSPTGR